MEMYSIAVFLENFMFYWGLFALSNCAFLSENI